MVELHFQKYLTNEKIKEIQKKHEFRDTLPIEQFIMDFEALYHIQEKLPDCVVKGGMAVPFHIPDKSLHRLSVDIDMVTSQSKETVIDTMKEISKNLGGAIEIPSHYIPPKSDKKLPLLTYHCKYKSSVNDNPEIKIEIFYDNQLQVNSKRITNNEEILGFEIDFPLSIFDHGALIGDKLTTLPFNTIGIGIGGGREHDVQKQIYDIAHILKSISGEIPIKEIVETFEIVSKEEISYYVKNPPTMDEILEDLLKFTEQLLIFDNQIHLNQPSKGRYANFRSELLSGSSYRQQEHVIDILLIKILAIFVSKKIKNEIEFDKISQKIRSILNELSRISTLGISDKKTLIQSIVLKHGKTSRAGQIILSSLPEYGFLYDVILELGNNN